jgi:hypothetical protein
MSSSRLSVAIVATIVLAGCAKGDQATKDTTPPAAAMAPAPKAVTMADLAGKWQVRSVPESGKDTTPTNYTLTVPADTSAWTITFATGATTKLHPMLMGDSIMTRTDVYTSVRRKGQKVMTDGMFRLQDGKLVGSSTAHYQVKTADSVLHLKVEGTRVP